MNLVGYIRKDPTFRMRFMRPGSGYSADNEAAPSNVVAFDSNTAKTFGVLQTGSWSGIVPTSLTRIVTWVDPGYIPLCAVMFNNSFGPDSTYRCHFLEYQSGTATPSLMVRNDGIYLGSIQHPTLTYHMNYVAYMVPT